MHLRTFAVNVRSCRLRLLSTDELLDEVLDDELSSSSSSLLVLLLVSAEVESDDESSSALVTVALWLVEDESADAAFRMLTLSASTVAMLDRTASHKAACMAQVQFVCQ